MSLSYKVEKQKIPQLQTSSKI